MLFIPEEGAEHPNFERLAPSEALSLLLVSDSELDEDMADLAKELFGLWVSRTPWQQFGGKPGFLWETHGCTIKIGLANITSPKTPLDALLSLFDNSPLQISRAVLSKVNEMGAGLSQTVSDDVRMNRHVRYENQKKWWKACFDPSLPPPDTDPTLEGNTDEGGPVEFRGMKIYLHGFRVAYGLYDGVEELSSNQYCQSIARLLTQKLTKYFGLTVPQIADKNGKTGNLDLLERKGRRGYRFSVLRAALLEKHGPTVRWREYEMLLAVRDLALALGFAHTIQWRREGAFCRFCLWEEKQNNKDSKNENT